MLKKITQNLIPIAIIGGFIIVGLIIAGSLVYINRGKVEKKSSDVLLPQQAAQIAIDYINKNMLQEGTTASLVSAVEENGIYKFRLKIGENEYDSYVTKNGKILFTQGVDLTVQPQTQEEQTATQETPKTEKPDVKLFVMSYCPYGLQAEKMFLPVYELLKNKTEMGVYFVNYIMHEKKELDENLRQYCIQKEEKEKYSNYLSCFVKDGNSEGCLSEANINRTKLATCVSETDAKYNITASYNDKSTWLNGNFPKFDIYADLNEKYGVRGSPTIVINDKVVEVSPRSPEKFKETVCQAFNSPPNECSQTLSDSAPSSGFGTATGSSSSGGGCGQ